MNIDGAKFKAYVDQQRLSKVKLADALGMTKQNLFSLFKSREFQKETKQKIEKVLNITWDMVNRVNIDPVDKTGNVEINNPGQLSQDYKDKYIRLLERNSKLEEKLDLIEISLKEIPDGMGLLTDLILKGQESVAQKVSGELLHRLDSIEKRLVSLNAPAPGKKPLTKGKH